MPAVLALHCSHSRQNKFYPTLQAAAQCPSCCSQRPALFLNPCMTCLTLAVLPPASCLTCIPPLLCWPFTVAIANKKMYPTLQAAANCCCSQRLPTCTSDLPHPGCAARWPMSDRLPPHAAPYAPHLHNAPVYPVLQSADTGRSVLHPISDLPPPCTLALLLPRLRSVSDLPPSALPPPSQCPWCRQEIEDALLVEV